MEEVAGGRKAGPGERSRAPDLRGGEQRRLLSNRPGRTGQPQGSAPSGAGAATVEHTRGCACRERGGSAAAGPGVRTRPPCATSLLTATNSAAAAVLCCSYVMAPISGSCVLLPQPVSALCGPQQRMEAHMAMLSLAPSADHTRTTNSSRRRALVAYTEAGAPMVRFSVAFRRFSHRFSTDSNPFGR